MRSVRFNWLIVVVVVKGLKDIRNILHWKNGKMIWFNIEIENNKYFCKVHSAALGLVLQLCNAIALHSYSAEVLLYGSAYKVLQCYSAYGTKIIISKSQSRLVCQVRESTAVIQQTMDSKNLSRIWSWIRVRWRSDPSWTGRRPGCRMRRRMTAAFGRKSVRPTEHPMIPLHGPPRNQT